MRLAYLTQEPSETHTVCAQSRLSGFYLVPAGSLADLHLLNCLPHFLFREPQVSFVISGKTPWFFTTTPPPPPVPTTEFTQVFAEWMLPVVSEPRAIITILMMYTENRADWRQDGRTEKGQGRSSCYKAGHQGITAACTPDPQ